MPILNDDYQAFIEASANLGVFPTLWFKQQPAETANGLIERFKFGAKMLREAAGIQHTQALECIAIAAGFSNWHELNTLMTKIAESKPQSGSREIIGRLKHTSVFMINPPRETSLTKEQLLAFEFFGAKLSKQAGIPLNVVLDKVCAGFCGNASWKEVKERNPLNAKAPLYKFEVDSFNPNTGIFIESYACKQLSEKLDDIYQEPQSKASKLKAVKWMESALTRQPDFLEAGLCLAHYNYEKDNLYEAYRIVDTFIKKTERLIPKGYRGVISWGSTVNRFYHRMLYLRMEINYDADIMVECLKDARKQLRLNPRDNLGVRYIYPLMQLELGQYEKASISVRAIKNEGNISAIIRAFSRYALNDQAGFIKNLTMALFDVPATRVFLLDDPAAIPDKNDWYRGIRPDMETLHHFGTEAYHNIPGLVQACTKYLANPVVQEAETRLKTAYKEIRQPDVDLLVRVNRWDKIRSKLAATIQEKLVG